MHVRRFSLMLLRTSSAILCLLLIVAWTRSCWRERQLMNVQGNIHLTVLKPWSVKYLPAAIGITAIAPSWCLIGYLRRRRAIKWRQEGLCPRCGYDLRASVQRCPECGTLVPSLKADNPRQ